MKKIIILIAMILIGILNQDILASGVTNIIPEYFLGYLPAPRLIKRVSEKVVLKGDSLVEFQRGMYTRALGRISYYDFRLYKGYDTYEANLLFKAMVAFTAFGIALKPETFEDGQVYTWVLRAVSRHREKNEASYNSSEAVKE